MSSEKDYYLLLGVPASATAAQIKEAYLSRLRIIHPDRFDREVQPREWRLANDMLTELNEAYGVLKDSEKRRAYDHRQSRGAAGTSQPENAKPRPKPSPPATKPAGDRRSSNCLRGFFEFSDLPAVVQSRLAARQKGKDVVQVRIAQDSIAFNLLLALALPVWFAVLFFLSFGSQWNATAWYLYSAITAVACIIGGLGVGATIRFFRCSITPAFYITPLYFIKTDFDLVSYCTLTNLRDIGVAHQFKDGRYSGSRMRLSFDGLEEMTFVSSEAEVARIHRALNEFGRRTVQAVESGDIDYFAAHDDFVEVPGGLAQIQRKAAYPLNVEAGIAYASTLAASIALLLVAGIVNANAASGRWVSHPTPERIASPSTSRDGSSGSDWLADFPVVDEPAAKPNTGNVEWTPPGDAVLADDDPWASFPEAPIAAPRSLLAPSIPAQSLPLNGEIQAYTSAQVIAPFEIKAAAGAHYLVKLVTAHTAIPVLTVFVRGGTTVKIDVPLGNYEVRYASGTEWYGYEYLFGPNTEYNKADKYFNFRVVGDEVQGFTITLYKVADGNLSTTKIKATEF